MKNREKILAAGAVVLLLVPMILMQFTDEVQWNATDFLVAGILLTALAIVIALIARKVKQQRARAVAILVAVILFLLVWMEMAVGLFGSPIGGN